MSTHRQHPYGQTGRHRAPETPRPHLRRLVATVGLCVVAALAIAGATVGAHPAVPTVQAAAPVQAVPVGPGQPRLLPRSGTVAVQEVGMRLAETTTAPATSAATEPTSAPSTTSATPTTAPTTTPTTASTPTGTADGTPAPTTTPTVTETPMPTTTSVATCRAVTT